MQNVYLKSLLLLLLICTLSSCTTRYYLVRHAEKAEQGNDPELSNAGHARAGALKNELISKGIDTVFVSSALRTQQTADSLTLALDKRYAVYPASLQGNQQLIRQLKSFRGNTAILVVGHSNTIPIVIDSIMQAPQRISIPEDDFDNLYLVTVKRSFSKKRRLTSRTYGATSP